MIVPKPSTISIRPSVLQFLLFVSFSFLFGVLPTNAGEYELSIAEKSVNLTGESQTAVVANDSLPAPILHWHEGEEVTIKVTNHLQQSTSIHWHGIILPYQMDGVPGISFDGIDPGQTFTYRFPIIQSGTYWYHGHSDMQEQQGLYGALIIEPARNQIRVERDYVVVLSDWSDSNPHRTMARLKTQNDYYNFQKRTVADFFGDIRRDGFQKTIDNRLDWGYMRMDPTDLADVTGATYRFLVNGRTPAMNWTAPFNVGDTVRLRFINASAMSYFDVRIPGLTMRVIEADGQAVMPVEVEKFRIAVAETLDVLVKPANRAYRIFAESMDRSGFAAATLAPPGDLHAELPAMSPRTLLTMADMSFMHGGHSGHHEKGPDAGEAIDSIDTHLHDSEHGGHSGPASHDSATDAMPVESHGDHSVHSSHSPASGTEDPHRNHRQHTEHTQTGSHATLNYQQLTTAIPDPEWPPADREITLRLTGNMNRYIWSFDGVKYSAAEPIRLRFGERVRFNYVNQTMMNHPLHLHGMWQILDTGQGIRNPRKHVINVPPGKTVSAIVVADNEGEWAFHCHLLYHMESGMFRRVIVENAGPLN
ncbi:MAG: copper resistance system multicopper oxidase [Gammaproteobacteria bacterium]